MRFKSITWFVGLSVILSVGLILATDLVILNAEGAEPDLYSEGICEECDEEDNINFDFEVIFQDDDGDPQDVILFLNDVEHPMDPDPYGDPVEGQYFYASFEASTIHDNDEFYYYAEDTTGNFVYLGNSDEPFYVGDYLGWGEKPVISNPYIYYDDDTKDYVFNVTYHDVEGDEGSLTLYLDNETNYREYVMNPTGGNPITGQNFQVSVPDSEINEDWEFYIGAEDSNGSYAYLYDPNGDYFEVRDVIGPKVPGDGDGGGDEGGGDKGFALPEFLNNAEVIVGIIGLVALGGGSAYGVWRRKKKHGRFSELLTQLDEVYGSFKLNPKRCELELEKMKVTINEDLKKNTIDQNNYSILKTRIDEIMGEIRSETIKSEVSELPKDIEIKIKDMLIDGEITRKEYDKILPIIKGSDMATDDKEKMKKMVESWVKEDQSK
ncbi:MAG: hypothetical protein JSW00_19250 [Thermoplasmata archaeon]|nr:MAG: hypothetical protein JSW00_19250 [Thermoplasmata archaeon]